MSVLGKSTENPRFFGSVPTDNLNEIRTGYTEISSAPRVNNASIMKFSIKKLFVYFLHWMKAKLVVEFPDYSPIQG